MTPERDILLDLEPDTPAELITLAERLERGRPVPSAGFRGNLRRRLLAGGAQAPRRLRVLIAGYAIAGSMLLFVGGLNAVGVGPLAT